MKFRLATLAATLILAVVGFTACDNDSFGTGQKIKDLKKEIKNAKTDADVENVVKNYEDICRDVLNLTQQVVNGDKDAEKQVDRFCQQLSDVDQQMTDLKGKFTTEQSARYYEASTALGYAMLVTSQNPDNDGDPDSMSMQELNNAAGQN
jgi:predicted small secreted protein